MNGKLKKNLKRLIFGRSCIEEKKVINESIPTLNQETTESVL